MTPVQNISDSPYKGSGQITREQFLFYEMRIIARLKERGMDDSEIYNQVFNDNLFQYPTEKMIKQMTRTCLNRLKALNDPSLVLAIASQPADVSKQICLFAMMKQYRLIWDFMITVIGEKFRQKDLSYSRMDINTFFLRLQEQDDLVASWSDSTIAKIKQVITKVLVENEYLDNSKANHINPVLITPILENAIRSNNDDAALPAFNSFS